MTQPTSGLSNKKCSSDIRLFALYYFNIQPTLKMTPIFVMTLTMLSLCQSADWNEESTAKRRRAAAVHALRIKGIPINARCGITEYMHRPVEMSMNALISGRESDNVQWSELCGCMIWQKMLENDKAVAPRTEHGITFVPSDHLYVLDFRRNRLPIFPETVIIMVWTKMQNGQVFDQTLGFNPVESPHLSLHVSSHTWRIGHALFNNQTNNALENVELVSLGLGWWMMDIRKVQ